jgi:hypothetical protein
MYIYMYTFPRSFVQLLSLLRSWSSELQIETLFADSWNTLMNPPGLGVEASMELTSGPVLQAAVVTS